MKSLLILYLLLSQSLVKADELDRIEILTPIAYDLQTSSTKTMQSKVLVSLGDLVNIDIAAIVNNKIAPNSKALAKYFPAPGELDLFVNSIVAEGKNNIIGNSLTDGKLIKFYEHIGKKLIGGITDKILATSGVKDADRREIWVKKILLPFQGCINRSKNSKYDADHCIEALIKSFALSAGVGLVYELSKSSLDSALPKAQRDAFNLSQVQLYKNCLKKTKSANEDVEPCALEAMSSGVQKITDLKLSKVINSASSSPATAKSIKQTVWSEFATCTKKVGSDENIKIGLNEQFIDCIDTLIKNTGMQLVQDKIQNTPTLQLSFSKSELSKLATDKVQDFKECADDLKKSSTRKNGMLDTYICETAITNDLTYQVVLKSLAQTAKEAFKKDKNQDMVIKISDEGKTFLDQCWDNKQTLNSREACLRKTILSYSQNIGFIKLDKSIPSDLKNKKELIQKSLKELGNCLEQKIPRNISEDKNLKSQTDFCANRTTLSVALQVANESITSIATEKKISEVETKMMIKSFVEDKFANCLGATPSEEKLDDCTGNLKTSVAISMATNQVRTSAEGKLSPDKTNELVLKLVNQNFGNCIGKNPSSKTLDDCVGELTKSATKSIVIGYEKKQIKEQINADLTPDQLKLVEDKFIKCVDETTLSTETLKIINECTKQFALSFARALGELKLNFLMKSVLGLNTYKEQKDNINQSLEKYNECLDNLEKFSIQDGVLEKLSSCTDGLERRGLNIVSSTVYAWMSTQEKDAATNMIKNEFAKFIPCLGGFLPPTPFDPNLKNDVDSILKPVSLYLSQYIEYSPEDAKRTFDEIVKSLSSDLKDVATNPESRKALIDSLYKNGALDQFLKSMVLSQIKETFDQISDSELPNELRSQLLNKKTFDKIFMSSEGKLIVDMVMEKILKPVLMDQASLKSPLIVAGMDSIKDKVIKLLVFSPLFGEQIIKSSVQNKINEMNGLTHFFAKVLYGGDSLVWDKVRNTPDGKIAEAYIRDNILLPRFKGISLTKAVENKYNSDAELLVKAAVKKYD
ncbi:MAG: hypothetical protein Q7U04_16600 [Bacteriovorax sp.]|nr:hypothetical protein [Bacteriovorax sp.]